MIDKLYNRILVPLDGSALAECSLEHVKSIAQGCEVPEVILFRAVEPLSSEAVLYLARADKDALSKAQLANQNQAKEYLDGIAKSLKNDGLNVRVATTDGEPAEEILNYAQNNRIDLIVMSTHGRSGVSRWFAGSVADKVMRHSIIPVLMVSPPGCRFIPAPEI